MAAQPYANKELDGDGHFRLGMDSANDPEQLPAGMYARAFNVVKRGGKAQCRPGHRQLVHLNTGMLQGAWAFKSTDSVPVLLIAVGGRVYRSTPPFDRVELIPNIQFAANAKRVYFETAVWSVRRNLDGSLTLLTVPRTVVIMQDDLSAPGYYDGAIAGHIRGNYSTPQGSVMKWSGDRLWIARGRRIFASDIGDPFTFFEGEYIGATGINSFLVTDTVTAMAEVTGVSDPFLLVFTEREGVAFQSSIRQRSAWGITANFQKTILPGIGCVAHASVINQFGQLWWMSAHGVVNLDIALAANMESKISQVDTNMAWSKRSMAEDLSGVCAGAFENYLMMSVPYADKFNRHTWIYDNSGLETNEIKQGGAWDSYWVGTRPVSWMTLNVDGADRIFHVSHDLDGENRLWESFQPERLDNGCPIVWGLESRGYTGGVRQMLEFRFIDVMMSEFSGDTEVILHWAGTRRGRYKRIGRKVVSAEKGSVRFDVPLIGGEDCIFALKRQSRVLRTEESRRQDDDTMTSCSVESQLVERRDYGFQLLVLCSGPGAIDAVRFFGAVENEGASGKCEESETGQHRATRFDGASARGSSAIEVMEAVNPELVLYTSTRAETVEWNGFVGVGNATRTSWLSQEDADRLAACTAHIRAMRQLDESAAPLIGGTDPVMTGWEIFE
jgi:hypothetical protein